VTAKVRLTPEDLWRLGDDELRRELVDGEVIEMAPAGVLHGKMVMQIGRKLADFVEGQHLGEVVAGDVGFVLSLPGDPDRVRAPDVAYISARTLAGAPLSERFHAGAPDLAVEILSPSDNPVDVQQKVRDYLEAGSRLVWIVAPKATTVTVYRPDGSARLLREGEALDGEDVLPGFTLPLADLFA
jgi:Uma2 family endonuclease